MIWRLMSQGKAENFQFIFSKTPLFNKNHTHAQNFSLTFIYEVEKRKLLKWANKKQNNFNIYNVAFFKKK